MGDCHLVDEGSKTVISFWLSPLPLLGGNTAVMITTALLSITGMLLLLHLCSATHNTRTSQTESAELGKLLQTDVISAAI